MPRGLMFVGAGLLLAAGALLSAAEPDLMHPKALAGTPGPATAVEMRQLVQNPPSEFRSMPLWVWNDQMEESRIREQLRQFRDAGMGGVFIHPRPGLMTDYLSPEWFRLWKFAMEEGRKLGLMVNIYDENSYPSGFAGGHVPARVPDSSSQYVQPELDASPNVLNARRSTLVAAVAVRKNAEGRVVSANRVFEKGQMQSGETLVVFRLRRAGGNPWTGEFPYVDLTNPATTPAFLETTYEAYKRAVGDEFGKTVRWAFADEPLLATGGAYDNAANALPLSFYTLGEFQKRNGYDLADQIASLYWDVGDYRKVRFDYWQTMHDLWKENFMRPMFEWNDRNNLQWTGHWMEHEWPFPWITPADANLYAFQHMPGIDMLEGTNLRLKGQDPHLLFTIKQVASVAHQLGRRAFCEAYGVAGWDGTLEHYKRFGDWLMVHGINFMDQHLAFTTVRGARKRDHPQSFSDVSAWWSEYKIHGDHLGRVSAASSRSESRNRVLVLEQTTSGFLLAARAGARAPLEAMRQNNAELNQFLADHQVDYDLGDEYMLEWFGSVNGKQMVVGKRAYDVVVIPPDMSNVRRQTIPLLESYVAAGGELLSLSDIPAYVDGRESDKLSRIFTSKSWRRLHSHADLLQAITERAAPRVKFDHALPAGVGFLERHLADGSRILFFANTGLQEVTARAIVDGNAMERLDTGEAMPYVSSNGKLEFPLQLAPAGSLLVLISRDAKGPAKPRQQNWSAVVPGDWKTTRNSPNALVLDYCDLTLGKETLRDMNTWEANWILWQRHGFERPAWDNAVQFRTRVFDKNHFPPDSGFTATFRLQWPAGVTRAAALSVELPELYKVRVNQTTVTSFEPSKLDPHIRTAPISSLLREGENVIEVEGRPFDVRMELENIFLTGDFGLERADRGFRVVPAKALVFGSWKAQGLPFYSGAVTYQAHIAVPAHADRVRVDLQDWNGSLARISIDGKDATTLAWPPYRAELAAAPGDHTVEITVVSTPRNLFGPFHNPSKPRMRAWPAAWAEFPAHQPSGAAYDLIDYGMMSPPVILVNHD